MAETIHHIIVGLSGGVDSSVTTLLLKERGYQVEALFMKNWEEDDDADYCAAAVDLEDAQSVADSLGVALHKVNFSADYWDRVFEHFLAEYGAGRTPNPDILCNREIKFKAFLDYALKLGADHIATGHYVRRDFKNGKYRLLKGRDPEKDQSYFLYTLGQAQLKHALFPVGELNKAEVRNLAEQHQLVTHNKKDSTGICFIGERKFRDFLSRYLPAQPGEIQTPEGEVIGHHSGLMYYTLGQRQGLGIGGVAGYPDEPWFVVAKDLPHNVLIAAQGHDHPLLFCQTLQASQLHWVSGEPPVPPFSCRAKVRYRQQDQACTIMRLEGECCTVSFDEPQRAVTPGQSVVFYDGEVCLGGGIIDTTDQPEISAAS
ncbi:MAG: tRNA 2-thiouridine(34) synthase MnmA [Chromatiales bacterium]|nr:tRNA 2-thiouridine(34) synthase MnmA [Chromatiales bacterium]